MAGSEERLVCPRCATDHPTTERFCSACHMPLVYPEALGAEDPPVSTLQEHARKIKRQYTEGEPVRVAWGQNQAEAEFIQSLLLEEGVPSFLRRAPGFDVPDFLAAGPREVLVPASGVATAREVLLQSEIVTDAPASTGVDRPLRLLAGVLGAFVIVALLAWIGSMLAS